MIPAWQVCSFTLSRTTDPVAVPDGWEPFAASDGLLVCRRRVVDEVPLRADPRDRLITPREIAARDHQIAENMRTAGMVP